MMNQCNGKECNGCAGYMRCRMFWREGENVSQVKPLLHSRTCTTGSCDCCNDRSRYRAIDNREAEADVQEHLEAQEPTDLSFKEMYDRVRSVCQQAGLDNTTITRVTFLEDGGYEVQIGIEASPDNWYGRRVPDPHTVDGISISYYIIGEE